MQKFCEKINAHFNEFFGKYTIADLIVCKFDDKLEIVFVSDGLLSLFDISLEEILGRRYSDLIVGGSNEQLFNEISATLRDHKTYSQERRINIGNNKEFWIIERGGLMPLEDGTTMLKLIITDISKQKEIEETLRISEKRYELVMNFSDVALFDYDMTTKQMIVTYMDEDNYRIPQVIENMPNYVVENGVVLPKSVDTFLEVYRKIFAGEPMAAGKVWTLNNEGETRLLEMQLVTIYDYDGKPIRAIGVHKDITDKFLLQQEKEYNRAITTSMTFVYEANITTDRLIGKNKKWIASEGLDEANSFSELISLMCSKLVAPDYQEAFYQKLDAQEIVRAYQQGNNMLTVSFVQVKNGIEFYYEKSINIVHDDTSDEYLIRCYIEDETKAQRALAEQRHYEAMISKSQVVYEINISKNQAISGLGHWKEHFNIEASSDYTKMVQAFAKNIVYYKDSKEFLKVFNRERLFNEFKKGNMIHTCEYRVRGHSSEQWTWRRCKIHLFEDPDLGYIRGFAYVDQIHEEKLKELDLLYKSQHDLLSGLYNKATVKEKIEEYLEQPEGQYGLHALLIIDLDNFKDVNDQFGHIFGDSIIAEAAAKIKSIFRDMDIAGRIGGDEFVVLMKNITQKTIATAKAKQICEAIHTTYTKKGNKYELSASVGIAYYKDHGENFEELYHAADLAMYNSKEYGRNRFSIYNEHMQLCYMPGHRQENKILVRGRNFNDYIGSYLFQLLYESQEPHVAVMTALEMIGKHFDFCRTYIFEDKISGKITSNTFEWCKEGVTSHIDELQDLNYERLDNLQNKFNEEGIFFLEDLSKAELSLRQVLETEDIKSLLVIAMKRDGVVNGFIGFDNCVGSTSLEPEQIWDLMNIGNIINMFINQLRISEQYERTNNLTLSVLNSIDSYLYLCDPNTYEILFINKKLQTVMPQAKVGDLCYKVYWGRTEPCHNCIIQEFLASGKEQVCREHYNQKVQRWLKCSATWVELIGHTRACLMNYIDISEYKK